MKHMYDSEILNKIKDAIGHALNVQQLKSGAEKASEIAAELFPGLPGLVQAELAEKWLLYVIEKYDNHIPVIGIYMDLPMVDRLQAAGVRHVIAWAYAKRELKRDGKIE